MSTRRPCAADVHHLGDRGAVDLLPPVCTLAGPLIRRPYGVHMLTAAGSLFAEGGGTPGGPLRR
jgi:hypothetical protein